MVILKGKGPNQIYTFLVGLDSTGKAVAVTQRTPPNPQTVDPIVAATAVKRADGVDYELTLNRQALKLGPDWAQGASVSTCWSTTPTGRNAKVSSSGSLARPPAKPKRASFSNPDAVFDSQWQIETCATSN